MRTTLELDDQLVATAKQMAKQQGASLGHVISELARQALATREPVRVRNGVPLITQRAGAPRPDMDLVNRLRDND